MDSGNVICPRAHAGGFWRRECQIRMRKVQQMAKQRGKLIVISGPSEQGRNTVVFKGSGGAKRHMFFRFRNDEEASSR